MNKNRYFILVLLILINFIVRIPSVPHEIGDDSFSVHISANSISTFGYANWIVHPSSIFGFYPYSYASAVPFILSGVSQTTGIEMETTLWIFSVFIGLFGIFTAYLLAGLIYKDENFKFFVAFSYSLSPGILAVSTWEVTTRGLFVILLPLFIYLFLKINVEGEKLKFSILSIASFFLLLSTHHYLFMTIPILTGIILLTIIIKLKIQKFFLLSKNIINIIFIIMFLFMLMLPFFSRFLIGYNRYEQLFSIIFLNIRYIGPLIFLLIPGLIYLLFKRSKDIKEWYILFGVLFYIPFIYQETYAHLFNIIFICIFLSVALINMTSVYQKKIFTIISIILIISVGFSDFYQHWRTNMGGKGEKINNMDEPTYIGGLWIKTNINNTAKIVGSNDLIGRRIFAISEVPTLIGTASHIVLAYGFTSLKNLNYSIRSPLDTEFYIDSPYKFESITPYPESDYFLLNTRPIDNLFAQTIINRYNLSYIVEYKYYESEPLIESIHKERNNIYNNGLILIWDL